MNLKGKNIIVFVVLAASVALAYQLPYMRYTFYDQMLVAYNLTNTDIGLIASTVNLINTICYPIGGALANRFSTKTLISITFGAFTVLSVWYAFATDFIMLMIIHALFAFFGIATLWSAYLAAVRNLGDEKSQSKLFGFNEATRGIVQALCGFVFLGLMGIAASQLLGFRYIMLFAAVVSFIFLLLTLKFMDGKKKGEAGSQNAAEAAPEKKYTIAEVLKNPGVWLVTFLVMFTYFFWTVGNSYLTAYTTQVLELDPNVASTLGILRSYVIVFVAGFLGGWLLDKFSYKARSFIVLLVLAIACTAGVMLTSAVIPLCVILTLVIAFIANIMKCTYWSTMGEAGIPTGMTALATGVISFIAFIPDWIYPTVFGIWIDDYTAMGNVGGAYFIIFTVMIVFGILGVITAILLWRRTKKLEAAGLVEITHR